MIKRPPNILIIGSQKSELNRVESFVQDVWGYYDLPQDCFNRIFLCISEAVYNAITHGNKGFQYKNIQLKLECDNEAIYVEIADEGEGFDHENVADPTVKENLLKESGRGIHIIKSLANKVEFNREGNCIRFQIDCK